MTRRPSAHSTRRAWSRTRRPWPTMIGQEPMTRMCDMSVHPGSIRAGSDQPNKPVQEVGAVACAAATSGGTGR